MSDGTVEIVDVLPEIDEIADDQLRDQTAAVWGDALERSGLAPADLRTMPASLHLVHQDIALAEHTRAVTQLALFVADTYQELYPSASVSVDHDVLVAGAVLHDVGKTIEYEEGPSGWATSTQGSFVRHPFVGVALCDARDVPAPVQEVIAVHSREGDHFERSLEATIVHYADLLNFDPFVGKP